MCLLQRLHRLELRDRNGLQRGPVLEQRQLFPVRRRFVLHWRYSDILYRLQSRDVLERAGVRILCGVSRRDVRPGGGCQQLYPVSGRIDIDAGSDSVQPVGGDDCAPR